MPCEFRRNGSSRITEEKILPIRVLLHWLITPDLDAGDESP
jgi:hypothetical protein